MNCVNILRNVSKRPSVIRMYSSAITDSTSSQLRSVEDPVVLSDDGSYFICWHPEKPYPYQCTKPLPEEKEAEKYVLKNMGTANSLYEKKKHPNTLAEELAKLTFTTKHRWFPRSRDRYAKKTPSDREYL